MQNTIRIGTRGSLLALEQARMVQVAITDSFPELVVQIVTIQSTGDKILDVSLSKVGDKGLFVKELEQALLKGEVDIAVHSFKDVPTQLPEGLFIGAVLPRGNVHDCLVSHKGLTLSDLKPGHVVASSSLRRKSQLLAKYPFVNVIDIRGNINTRIKKMENGYCDAMILAAAGVERIGLTKYVTQVFTPDIMVPAVAQGAIAIEVNRQNTRLLPVLEKLNHPETETCTLAERLFLNALHGGCQIPIGCLATINNSTIQFKAFAGSVDGQQTYYHHIEGDIANASQLALQLADQFLSGPANKILVELRNV